MLSKQRLAKPTTATSAIARCWLPLYLLSMGCLLLVTTSVRADTLHVDPDQVEHPLQDNVRDQTTVPSKPQATLELLPRSCVLRNPEAPCVDRLLVRWQLSIAMPICLWLHGGNVPLFCVQQQQGERELQMPVRQSLLFELASEATRAPLAQAELLVLTGPAANKRRRYQHPWSVF